MKTKRSKKRRRKVRYSTVTFKLTLSQKKSLLNYCKARRTTPTKLIKKHIRKYLEKFAFEVPEEYYVTENQLDMFEEPVQIINLEPKIELEEKSVIEFESDKLRASAPEKLQKRSEPGVQESLF